MPFDLTPLPLPAQVLIKALDLLRERGWCQDKTESADGSYCMFGAIRQAGNLFGSGSFFNLGIPWPVRFNDEPGRTFAEVEQWFLDQISKAMKEGENR